MKIFKKYGVIIAVVLPFFILVMIKQSGNPGFHGNPAKLAEPSVNQSNIVNEPLSNNLSGEKLIVNLDGNNPGTESQNSHEVRISADSILSRSNFELISDHKGPVLLKSSDKGVSARIWMILSQMQVRNLYILTSDIENEIAKNKFRPDTLIGPEL